MDDTTTTHDFSFWALIACLGCAAVAASFFLPWLALGAGEQSDLGVSQGDLRALEDAARKEGGETPEVLALVRRIRAGEPITGRAWKTLLGWTVDHAEAQARLEPREVRAFRAANVALGALPWLAALLALLLLGNRLRRMPAAAIGALFLVGLLLGGLAGLLWLGASVQAQEHAAQNAAHLGLGMQVLAVGGLACLAAALFGVSRRTWWRGWGLGLALCAAIVAGVVLYVRG